MLRRQLMCHWTRVIAGPVATGWEPFARYVGIDWDSSAYNYTDATPDRSDWRHGDRLVKCMAEDPDHLENSRISLRKVKE